MAPSPYVTEEADTVGTNVALFLTVDTVVALRGASIGIVGMLVTEECAGVMAAGVYNHVSGPTDGTLLSGVYSFCGGDTRGAMISGVFTWADSSVTGVQLAGLFNHLSGPLMGVQVSSIYNDAESVQGVQVSGFVNSSHDVTGAQIGLVNVAGNVSGAQVGLINIATEENQGLALGLFNYAPDGIFGVEAWVDEALVSSLGVAIGTRSLYSLFLCGRDFASDDERWHFGLGWGGRFTFGQFFVDTDVLLTSHHSRNTDWSVPIEETLLPHIRLKTGMQVLGELAVFIGADFQFHIPGLYVDEHAVRTAWGRIDIDFGDGRLTTIVPRLFFGVELF